MLQHLGRINGAMNLDDSLYFAAYYLEIWDAFGSQTNSGRRIWEFFKTAEGRNRFLHRQYMSYVAAKQRGESPERYEIIGLIVGEISLGTLANLGSVPDESCIDTVAEWATAGGGSG